MDSQKESKMKTIVGFLLVTLIMVSQCSHHTLVNRTGEGHCDNGRIRYLWHKCGTTEACLCGNTSLGYLMNCSQRSLYDIPRDIPSNVSIANFSYNQVNFIQENAFTMTVSLISLDLSHNKIKTLPEGTFRNTVALMVLNISRNYLTTVPGRIFINIGSLRILHFENNSLSVLPPRVFHNLRNLTVLQLSFNNLSTLPEDLFATTTSLKFLNLRGNKLSSLPESIFANTILLTELKGSSNMLKTLPKRLFEQTTNLHYLQLSENKLTTLPDGLFNKTINLTKIELLKNELKTLPEGLFDKTIRLKWLYINWNSLEKLPPNLFQFCSELTDLSLGENNLTEFPRSIFNENATLNYLNLCSNRIEVLDDDIFTNANNTYIVDNDITAVKAGAFNSSRNLRKIFLSKNKISSLPEDTFIGMELLHHLTLYGNNLTSLPAGLFRMINLTYSLDLSSNELSEIPKGLFSSFEGGHGLLILQLQRNNLRYLPNGTFAGLPRLTYLILANNKIHWTDGGAFSGTDLRCIYLVSNNISVFFNNSFTKPNLEIHLYKNKVTNMSQDALSGISNSSKLYMSCDNIQALPRSTNDNVQCVNDESLPYVYLSANLRILAESFEKQGFECETLRKSKTRCKPCPVGTYGNGFHTNCTNCPRGGFYQDEIGSTECKHCNKGSFVKDGIGSSQGDCKVCPEGTNQSLSAGYRACFCKEGYFRMSRFNECSICTDDGMNCSQDYIQILPGYYWNWSFPKTDAKQYFLFVENLKYENRSYNNDTVNYTGSIPKIYPCPQIESCINEDGLSLFTGGCAVGYRGWMCTKCQSNHYPVLNVCHICPSKVRVLLIFFTVVILIFILLSYIVWKNKKRSTTRSPIDKLSSRLKIILGFYQVIGDLFESFHSVEWKDSVYIFGKLLSLVLADFLQVFVRPQCLQANLEINPLVQFKIALAFPVAVIVLSLCFYAGFVIYMKFKNGHIPGEVRETPERARSKLFTFVVIVLFVTYAPTCNCIFSLYPAACKTFDIYSKDNDSISLLRADYDISCEELRSYQVTAYIATVFYVIAFPAFLLCMLRRFCDIKGEQGTQNETHDNPVGEMSPLLSRRVLVITTQPGWVKFLCENYKRQLWFWEIIEMTRKVIQTVMVTLLGWESPLTRLSAIGMSVLFLTLHVKYSPMKYKFEHRLQLFSLTAIFVNILVASVHLESEYSSAVFIGLFVLDIIIIVIVAGEAVLPCLRFILRWYKQCKANSDR